MPMAAALQPALQTPSSVWRIRAAMFLAGFATFSLLWCVQPLLPVIAQVFTLSPADSSLAVSLTTSALALAILCAAALSEGFGRRGLMFASMTLAALLNLAAGMAPDWHWLLVIRAVEGFALGGVPAVAMAYLAEEIPPGQLGRAMGIYVAGTAFGGMCGRVGTGILVDLGSWRAALGIIGVIGLVAGLGFIALLPPSRNFVRRLRFEPAYHLAAWGRHLRHPALPMLFLISFVVMGAFVTIYNYASFRLMAAPYRLSQSEIGLIFVVYVFGIAASPVAGGLADRIGRFRTLAGALCLTGIGIVLTAAAGLPVFVLGVVAVTAGFFGTHSVASGWVGRLAAGNKGHASSLYLLSYYAGSSIAGSAGGWFWGHGGWDGVVAFTLVLLGIGLAAAIRIRFVTPKPTVSGA